MYLFPRIIWSHIWLGNQYVPYIHAVCYVETPAGTFVKSGHAREGCRGPLPRQQQAGAQNRTGFVNAAQQGSVTGWIGDERIVNGDFSAPVPLKVR